MNKINHIFRSVCGLLSFFGFLLVLGTCGKLDSVSESVPLKEDVKWILIGILMFGAFAWLCDVFGRKCD